MSDRPTTPPESDIYTVLIIFATVLVIGATIFLAMRSQQLFGSWNPFFLPSGTLRKPQQPVGLGFGVEHGREGGASPFQRSACCAPSVACRTPDLPARTG